MSSNKEFLTGEWPRIDPRDWVSDCTVVDEVVDIVFKVFVALDALGVYALALLVLLIPVTYTRWRVIRHN